MPDVIDKRKTVKLGPFANPDGSLNQAGRDFLTRWLETWVPVALFKSKFRGLYLHACMNIGPEETESACMMGITRSMLSYDPSVCKFQTYAAYAMRNSVTNTVRLATKHKERGITITSGDAILNHTDRLDLFETLGELDSHEIERADDATAFRRALIRTLKGFTKRDRAIFYLHHGLLTGSPKSMAACGKAFGITRARVEQLLKRMRAELDPHFLELRERGMI